MLKKVMHMNTKSILIAVLLFIPLLNHAQYWEYAGQMLHPVAAGQALVIGSKIYIVGGFSDELQASTDMIQEFDPYTNMWTVVGSMNESRVGLSAVVYDNELYYFGGIDDSSLYINSFEKFNSTDSDTGKVFFENQAFNREYAASIVVDSLLYMFGGSPNQLYDSLSLPHLSIFDFDSAEIVEEIDTLFQTAETPNRQMLAAIDNDIYIFGGVSNTISNKIYRYDTKTKEFERLENDLQVPRAGGAAVYLEGLTDTAIYLIGGSLESESAVNTVEVFHQTDVNLSPGYSSGISIARTDLMAVPFEGNIYVFGGFDASGNVVGEIEIFNPDGAVSASDDYLLPGNKLHQNYPNPFNPSTQITFEVSEASKVIVDVYSVLGERVATLTDGYYPAGVFTVNWHGMDFSNKNVASGIYFCRMSTETQSITMKMTLLR